MTVLICVKKGPWVRTHTNKPVGYPCPNYGETVTVLGTETIDGRKYYLLKQYDKPLENGFPALFAVKNFREITDDKPEACDREFLKQIRKCREPI